MADIINKKVIVRVDIDTAAYAKELKIINSVTADMVKQNAAFKKSGDILNPTFISNKLAIAANNKEISDLVRVINNAEKANGHFTGSENQLKAALSAATYEWSKESEVTEEARKRKAALGEQVLSLSNALKTNETAVGNNYRRVGEYKQSIMDAYKEMGILKKEVTQIGFVMATSMTKIDKASSSLDNMTKAGLTGTPAFAKVKSELAELNSTLEFQQMALKGATDAVTAQEEALKPLEKEAAKIGFVFGQGADSIGELKAELKAAKSEAVSAAAAFGMDSKEFIEASKRAGELADRMKDVNESTKVFTSGSKFEQFGNSLRGIGGDLMSLDFEGAAEKAKGLSTIVKSFSFAGMVSGGKALAVTMYEVATAMMALPIFWVAAGIAGITAAVMLMSKATHESTAAIISSLDKVDAKYQALYDGQIKLSKALGQDTEKTELKKLKLTREVIGNKIKQLEVQANTIFGLNEDEKKQIEELRAAHTASIYDISAKKIDGLKKQTEDSKKATEKSLDELVKSKAILQKLEDEEAEKNRKRNEERLDSNKKLLDQLLQQRVDLIVATEAKETAQASLNNARAIESINEEKGSAELKSKVLINQQSLFEKELLEIKDKYRKINQEAFDKAVEAQIKADQPRIDAAQKIEDELQAIADKSVADSLDRSIAAMDKENELREQNNQSIRDGVKQLEQQLSDSIFSAQSARLQRETDTLNSSLDRNSKIESDKLQAQLTSGAITQSEFDAASLANQTKFEADQLKIKKDAFEKDKQLKLQQVGINLVIELSNIAIAAAGNPTNAVTYEAAGISQYAIQAGVAIARAGIQAGAISSAQFAEGGVLKGNSHENGGMPFKVNGRTGFEAEGDEIILTKGVYRNPHLRSVASQLNVAGGGIPFAYGGIAKYADGGAMATRLSSPIDQTISAINTQRRLNRTLPPPVVVVSDIINGVDTHVKVVSRGDI